MTHEPYITLIYEYFWSGEIRLSHIPKTFRLFHFSILREFVEAEFFSLKVSLCLHLMSMLMYNPSHVQGSLSFDYNLEAIIDDWVLMVCFLGNDFIPAIPNDKQVLSTSITDAEVYIVVYKSACSLIVGMANIPIILQKIILVRTKTKL